MKLNRNNYEEYFILYMDNELGIEDRREVEVFVQENPDLKAELDILLLSRLTPDAEITFNNKESLMIHDSSLISMANYEEWLLTYVDNELAEEERKTVERFVSSNPLIQKELDLLQQTRLQPEAIVFPNKELLYRREEKARIIPMRWWRIAAAAVLVLGIGTTVVLLNQKQDKKDNVAIDNSPKVEKSTSPTVKPENTPAVTSEEIANNDQIKTETPAAKKKNLTPKEKQHQAIPVKKDEPVIADINNDKKKTNDLPEPVYNPNVVDKPVLKDIAGTNDIPSDKSALTDSQGNSEKADVTSNHADPSNKTNASEKQVDNPDAVYASQKGGLRGFLRKVTRTFEKRTNIKATDDDDRLLIAGLAIKLN